MRACLKSVKRGKQDNGEKSVQRIDGCRDDAWTLDNKKKKEKKKKMGGGEGGGGGGGGKYR